MKISLITPANKYSRNGNRTSAERWARFLRGNGHHVSIKVQYNGEPADLMIALHAWRSAAAVRHYREHYPKGPLIVALGGTDVNTFLKSDPTVTLDTMRHADALVCLHDLVKDVLPSSFHKKLHIIKQSAKPLLAPRKPSTRFFDVCVIGHLREEKDPFRAALAARLAERESRLRVFHAGKAYNANWAERAKKEMRINPRYIWTGDMPAWRIRKEFIKTQLMIISSEQEGGANVISEAVVAGVPVIASDIPGNVGVLGRNYPGYYPVKNEIALAAMLQRAELEPTFLYNLAAYGANLRDNFLPNKEAASWCRLINQVTQAT